MCRYHTVGKANCESPTRQQGNQIMLQGGEKDHRQRTGNQSAS